MNTTTTRAIVVWSCISNSPVEMRWLFQAVVNDRCPFTPQNILAGNGEDFSFCRTQWNAPLLINHHVQKKPHNIFITSSASCRKASNSTPRIVAFRCLTISTHGFSHLGEVVFPTMNLKRPGPSWIGGTDGTELVTCPKTKNEPLYFDAKKNGLDQIDSAPARR